MTNSRYCDECDRRVDSAEIFVATATGERLKGNLTTTNYDLVKPLVPNVPEDAHVLWTQTDTLDDYGTSEKRRVKFHYHVP